MTGDPAAEHPDYEPAPSTADLFQLLAELPDERASRAKGERLLEDARASASPYTVLSSSDLEHLPAPKWLIDGLLPQKGLAALVGSRGLGKSLLALDWAASTGSEEVDKWYGRALASGAVLYVALEGFTATPERLRAWRKERRADPCDLYWWPDTIDGSSQTAV